jgi:DNA helicase-2/ATP-dependent DNA helicase PcrA
MPRFKDEDLLSDLTTAQREATTHFEGPLLILAAAGSGKTRVITRRVAYLLLQGVRADSILAITFTNKAANEMKRRVEAILPNSRVWISTFHSFGAGLLRRYGERLGLERNFTIYDQTDRHRVIKAALEAAKVDPARFRPERIEGAISSAKNRLISPERYGQQASDFFEQVVAHVYPVYEQKLRAANALDFDDLLYWPGLALQHDQEIRAGLDARFRFVLIDEYQDTNHAQYQIARGLSIDQPNLCVVGDPDQSIYKWRGSDIRNILDFERDFPDARIIMLERNYRSTKSILQAANCLISHNRKRKPKDLVTENPAGKPVQILTFEDGLAEAEEVARRIRKSVEQEGRKFLDFAIFLRVNALSRAVESAFLQQRVPYQMVRGLAFFERKENRDILAYLRLLLNPRDDLSFLRIVNEPARGIGKTSLEHLQSYAEPRGLSLLAAAAQVHQVPAIRGRAVQGLNDFSKLMEELGSVAEFEPEEIIRKVIDRSGYRKMLLTSSDPEDAERLANIEELITAAKQFASEESGRTLADFLESITLASDIDGWDDRQDCVSIMTLHAAKGLEFPVVYVLAAEQGILPHQRSLEEDDPEELEEERRLTFVGITRAKEEINLCHARKREFRGQSYWARPSMFLDELGEEAVERQDRSFPGLTLSPSELWRSHDSSTFEIAETGSGRARAGANDAANADADVGYVKGMMVRHERYGMGRVTDVSGFGVSRKIRVRFPTSGERTFLAAKAKFAIVTSH